jgi:CubicO group peptidase (beta-lactamase class C family)
MESDWKNSENGNAAGVSTQGPQPICFFSVCISSSATAQMMKTLTRPGMLLTAVACGLLLTSLSSAVQTTPGEDLSEALEKLRAKADVPGMVIMAVQDGEVVAWGAAGVRVHGGQDPIRIEDPMHLGSCAKAMTSTLVARLIEKKVLTWETTIAEAMPEFAKKIDGGYHAVTVEALIKHQAGIAERRRPEMGMMYGALETMEGSTVEIRLELLEKVLSLPPSPSAPGTFDYSNFGYMTAGAMLETLTGTPWEKLMVDELFKPLAMTSAGIGSPLGKEVPVGHRIEDGRFSALPPGPEGNLHVAMGPAGLVHCNLKDWSLFVSEHLAGERGDDGLISAASYQRLHQDHGGSGYAAGWSLDNYVWGWGQAPRFQHNGSDNTWHSFVSAVPEVDLTLLVGINCAGPRADAVTSKAQDLLLRSAGFKD